MNANAVHENAIIADRYILREKIGKGSFGEVYLAEDKDDKKNMVAMKLEEVGAKYPQLHLEFNAYKAIPPAVGIPKVYAFIASKRCTLMAMERLGESLEALLAKCQHKFTLKTTMMLGLQMLDRLQYVHEHGFLHRDVKPDNFLMGRTEETKSIVYIIDMGLSRRYKLPNNDHIPFRDKRQLTGTPRFASVTTHEGIEPSRRDDLESMGYMLVYFLNGKLPWQGLMARTKQDKYKRIGQKKKQTKIPDLCRGLPKEMEAFMNHCRGLEFTTTPDYKFLRGCFEAVIAKENFEVDYKFDWSAAPPPSVQIPVPRPEPRMTDISELENRLVCARAEISASSQKIIDLKANVQLLSGELQRMYKHLTQFCPRSLPIPSQLVNLYRSLNLPLIQAPGEANPATLSSQRPKQSNSSTAVRLRSLDSAEERLITYTDPTSTICFTADNKFLIAGSMGRGVRSIDLQRMVANSTLFVHGSVVVVIPRTDSIVIAGCSDGAIYQMDVATRKIIPLMPSSERAIISMCIVDDRGASFLMTLFTDSRPGYWLRVSELEKELLGYSYDVDITGSLPPSGIVSSKKFPLAVVYGPDGFHVICVSGTGMADFKSPFKPAYRVVYATPISPRRILVLSCNTVDVFDMDTGRLTTLHTFPAGLTLVSAEGRDGDSFSAVFNGNCHDDPVQFGPFAPLMLSHNFNATTYSLSADCKFCAGFVPQGDSNIPPMTIVAYRNVGDKTILLERDEIAPSDVATVNKRRNENAPPEPPTKQQAVSSTMETRRTTRASSTHPLPSTS